MPIPGVVVVPKEEVGGLLRAPVLSLMLNWRTGVLASRSTHLTLPWPSLKTMRVPCPHTLSSLLALAVWRFR